MNRVILIGNGFDLAHGLKTSYQDFIDDFWGQEKKKVVRGLVRNNFDFSHNYEDDIIKIKSPCSIADLPKSVNTDATDYDWFVGLSNSKYRYEINGKGILLRVIHKNAFLERISNKRWLQNWVDIEDEYYLALNECLTDTSNQKVEKLNKEFFMIQDMLEEYLTVQTEKYPEPLPRIKVNVFPEIYNGNRNLLYNSTLFLSFNYTNMEKEYIARANALLENNGIKASAPTDTIHIHGELNNQKNPIIFGYGDEVGEKYKILVDKNDNRYLENVKSFKYLDTSNYKDLRKFIESNNKYEVFVMGHSCGISDRTLLNILFGHKNCVSIKIFYHKKEDGTDNYGDMVKNISRHFSDNSVMRDKIVEKPRSCPLS